MPLRTPRASARGRGQSKNQARKEAVAASNGYPFTLAVVLKKRLLQHRYHAFCEDITDEEMRSWTSTDQDYLCRKRRGDFDKGIERLEEVRI
ncbi:hypothetical protein PoB_005115100 [Plakobranchus ocellatus]|uniref:Uncharacterized protein n=1 Tax=Plakobranchus ocellatus TaxID=259542 RepID=A0AAV4BZV0_9GAST|nr:hypothetical protein PoB_005115100 [Plakobranchus ocellatus]